MESPARPITPAPRDEQAGYFCGIFQTDRVRLLFEHGASLPDPEGLFTGGGTRTRHIDLRSGETVQTEGIRALIDAAILHGVLP